MSETTPLLAEGPADATAVAVGSETCIMYVAQGGSKASLTLGGWFAGTSVYFRMFYVLAFLLGLAICLGVPLMVGLFATDTRERYSLPFCDPKSQYQVSPPEGLWQPRVCGNLTICTPTQYETIPPTRTTDRTCGLLTICTSEQWESVPPTKTSDRKCNPLTICGPKQYISKERTRTSDRQCAGITVCTQVQYEKQAPTKYSDRICLPYTVCKEGEYEAVAPQPTSDRVCKPYTTCTALQYELSPPSKTSDRVCLAIRNCTGTEYETKAPTPTSDRECKKATECKADQYEIEAPTKTTDRKCKPLTRCTHLEYQSVAPTRTTDRVCDPLTECKPGEYEVEPPSATSDRKCGSSFVDKIVEAAPVSALDAKKDGGLKGDGTSDDTDALEKLIEKAQAEGKGVFLPAGRYMISKDIDISKGVAILGSSKGVTVLQRPPKSQSALMLGKGELLDSTPIANMSIENVFFDGITVRFWGFGKVNHTIRNCVFFASSPIKAKGDFWGGFLGNDKSSFIDWSQMGNGLIESNVFLRPSHAKGSAITTWMTNGVIITRNIFGPKLSPDGLDWLTMTKWKKYTGAWPAMIEKLRFIRNEYKLPFDNNYFEPETVDAWLDTGLVKKDNLAITAD